MKQKFWGVIEKNCMLYLEILKEVFGILSIVTSK